MKKLNAVEYLIEIPHKGTTEHRRVNVNRMRLYRFWEDGRPSVTKDKPLTEFEKNQHKQFCKKPKPGQLAILAMEATEENPACFEVVKILKKKENGDLLVQWWGNKENNPLGCHRPSWVDPRDNKHYFRTKPILKKHVPYTNDISNTRVTEDMLHISGFKLTEANSIPAIILKFIHMDENYDWFLPVPVEKERPIVDLSCLSR